MQHLSEENYFHIISPERKGLNFKTTHDHKNDSKTMSYQFLGYTGGIGFELINMLPRHSITACVLDIISPDSC